MTETSVVEQICPYCRHPLQPEADSVSCPRCHATHHLECWVKNNGCAIAGCQDQQNVATPPSGGGSLVPPPPVHLIQPENVYAASGVDVLKPMNIWLLILFMVITLGIYEPFWFIARVPIFNRMQSQRKLTTGIFIAVVVCFGIIFITSFISGLVSGNSDNNPVQALANLISLVAGIMMLIQRFAVLGIFRDHFRQNRYSGVATFFLGVFYLQYIINRLTPEERMIFHEQ